MKMFIITWKSDKGSKIWESERYASTAREALAGFNESARRMAKGIKVLAIADIDAFNGGKGLSLRIV